MNIYINMIFKTNIKMIDLHKFPHLIIPILWIESKNF